MFKRTVAPLINFSKVAMTHQRDIMVFHTVDKRIFFDIPLYSEEGMIIRETVIEKGRMIVIAEKRSTPDGKISDTSKDAGRMD